MRYLAILTFCLLLFACSKEENVTEKKQTEENDNSTDTNLTIEEKFSSSILIDFLNDSDDEDLASFLETEVYKMSENFNGAAVVEITPSTWLVSFEKDGTIKNYLLQKFVDFRSNEYYFRFKETTLTVTDIISKPRNKSSASEQ